MASEHHGMLTQYASCNNDKLLSSQRKAMIEHARALRASGRFADANTKMEVVQQHALMQYGGTRAENSHAAEAFERFRLQESR